MVPYRRLLTSNIIRSSSSLYFHSYTSISLRYTTYTRQLHRFVSHSTNVHKSCCNTTKMITIPNVQPPSPPSTSIPASSGKSSSLSLFSFSFWLDIRSWRRASLNTLHCLVGCSIGDLGMLYYLHYNQIHLSMPITMGLAMVSGISTSIMIESLRLSLGPDRLPLTKSIRTAVNMSLISMMSMEAAENTVQYLTAMYMNNTINDTMSSKMLIFIDPSSSLFWMTLSASLFAGFITPLPYNYYIVRRFNKACH